jgi:hypothetical protein
MICSLVMPIHCRALALSPCSVATHQFVQLPADARANLIDDLIVDQIIRKRIRLIFEDMQKFETRSTRPARKNAVAWARAAPSEKSVAKRILLSN